VTEGSNGEVKPFGRNISFLQVCFCGGLKAPPYGFVYEMVRKLGFHLMV
jgi:hypothetical protein